MKRQITLWPLFILLIVLLTACNTTPKNTPTATDKNNDNITVYVSIYPMYDFASKIGGDKINLSTMVPSGTEPHDWEPTAIDITHLEEADVFIYNGAGMEHWVEDVLASLQNENLIIVEASNKIDFIKGHSHHGEHKEEGTHDPHVWLYPLNAKIQMENIKNALVEADPSNKDYYETNYEKYAAECDALDQEFKDILIPLVNKDIIVSHEAYGYLCKAYDLNQIGIEGLSSDSDPDPARMAEIINLAKEKDINTIFFEETVSSKVAETIAKEIGAKTAVLSPIEGLSKDQKSAGDDYFSVMRQNLDALKSALQ